MLYNTVWSNQRAWIPRKFIHFLVSGHQVAFLRGHNTAESFICALVAISRRHTREEEAAIIKLDREKKFNNVTYAILERMQYWEQFQVK